MLPVPSIHRQKPYDSFAYLTTLAQVLGENPEAVLCAVERQLAGPHQGWFEAEKRHKLALLLAALVGVEQESGALVVYHLGVGEQPPRHQPLAEVAAELRRYLTQLVVEYEGGPGPGRPPLELARAVLAVLLLSGAACRIHERANRGGRWEFAEGPEPMSRQLERIRLHVLLLIGQYELPTEIETPRRP